MAWSAKSCRREVEGRSAPDLGITRSARSALWAMERESKAGNSASKARPMPGIGVATRSCQYCAQPQEPTMIERPFSQRGEETRQRSPPVPWRETVGPPKTAKTVKNGRKRRALTHHDARRRAGAALVGRELLPDSSGDVLIDLRMHAVGLGDDDRMTAV